MEFVEPSFNSNRIYKIPLAEFYSIAVSVDCVLFAFDKGEVEVLLIQRGTELYENTWALPGDLVYPTENIDDAAKRILFELTGLHDLYLAQAQAFGDVNRHPQGRVVTVGYFALIKKDDYKPEAHSWAKQVKWHKISEVPKMPFDHNDIVEASLTRLRKRARRQPIGFNLLPEKFTLLELQALYESLLDEKFDKPNFRKKVLDMKLLEPLNEVQQNVKHRPAKLFKFNEGRYNELVEDGFDFTL
jgi:ADP-ribose pyrophosphatase YjhB (NUDIX family)